MKAMVFEEYGGPEKLVIKEIPTPEPLNGEIRIKVKAFGVNRAETYMRRGLWGDVVRVSGIECVGEVDADPSGKLSSGQTVAAIMGGMGRTRNGSYAEYTCVPASNVFPLETTLPWADLAAIPESYATAWTCLFENLKLTKVQFLLVRGATSALGQAAVSLAAEAGAQILATTRSKDKAGLLKGLGAGTVLVESSSLSGEIRELFPQGIDAVLDLVGNTVLRDSLKTLRRGGRLCQAGFLGGTQPVDGFNPIFDLPSGVDLSFFGSFVLGTAEFPLTNIPMQRIIDNVAKNIYQAKPAKVFAFEQLPDAHRLMESNTATGKIVVVL